MAKVIETPKIGSPLNLSLSLLLSLPLLSGMAHGHNSSRGCYGRPKRGRPRATGLAVAHAGQVWRQGDKAARRRKKEVREYPILLQI